MVELGRYFNALLSKNKIARNTMVLTYFSTHQADQDSEQKIMKLSQLILDALQQEKIISSKKQKGGASGGDTPSSEQTASGMDDGRVLQVQ